VNLCRKCGVAFVSVFAERVLCWKCQARRERAVEFWLRCGWVLGWVALALALFALLTLAEKAKG